MDFETENLVSNHTFSGTYTQEQADRHLIRAIVVTICLLLGVAGNISLAYIIFHYKRLRTLANIILANWALANIGFMLPSSGLLDLTVYYEDLNMPGRVICVEYQLEKAFAIAVKIFMNWMCVNWCLGAYWPEKQAWFRKNYKMILALIWSGVVFWAVKCAMLCWLRTYLFYDELVLLFNLLLLLIVLVTTHILHAVQKFKQKVAKQSTLMKTIVTLLMLTWISYYITYIYESAFVGVLIYCVVYLNSIMVILVLLKCHKGFRTCFLLTMSCSGCLYSSSLMDDSSAETIINQNIHVELDPDQPTQVT